jgi:hypothetical protein
MGCYCTSAEASSITGELLCSDGCSAFLLGYRVRLERTMRVGVSGDRWRGLITGFGFAAFSFEFGGISLEND